MRWWSKRDQRDLGRISSPIGQNEVTSHIYWQTIKCYKHGEHNLLVELRLGIAWQAGVDEHISNNIFKPCKLQWTRMKWRYQNWDYWAHHLVKLRPYINWLQCTAISTRRSLWIISASAKVQMRKNQLSLISHILTDRMQVPENQLQQLRPYQARVQKSLEKIDVPGRVETLQKK